MSSNHSNAKEVMIKGLKEFFHGISQLNKSYNTNECPQSSVDTEISTKNLSKSVKSFVEHSLSSDIDNHLTAIGNANNETWKIDVHNLSKVFLDQPKLTCVQDNISNILDTCLKEIDDPNVKYFNDSEIDISPLLQPEHIIEVAECISAEKPLDVRLNAFHVLFKSHFIDAINGEGWFLLQKKLVENLCDGNIDIFMICLKVHAKLASCSSSVAIKECTLNLLDSLSRHYYLQSGECKVISLKSMHFYHMVYLTRLLLDTFREATLNVARFGESKLDEMIENLIQLMSIHVPSKQRNKPLLSPLEVVSILDPNGNWLANLTHFTLTRRLLFASLCRNVTFLRIAVEEIINWVNEPVIPSRNTSKILQGEINGATHKYSLFCHSLAVFKMICSFGIGRNMFPINTNKKEELLSTEDVLSMLIISLNDARFDEIMHAKGAEVFTTFIAQSIAKLLCLKEINGCSLLLLLLRKYDNQEPLTNPLKIKILDIVSQYQHPNNPFVNNLIVKRKHSVFLDCFIPSSSCSTIKNSENIKWQSSEYQGSMDTESELLPSEIYLRHARDKLKIIDLKEVRDLIQILSHLLKNFSKKLGINYILKAQITQLVAIIYTRLQENFKNPELKHDNDDVNLACCCTQFLLQTALTPLGFYELQDCSVVAPLLLEGIQHPIINWSDPVWLLFISKATTTNDGCKVLTVESNQIIRKELAELWYIIDEDCSTSEIQIEDTSNQLLQVVALLSLSYKGVKAVLNDSRDGSDITLTDEYNIKPYNLYILIQQFALNTANCLNFIHHQFALMVLEVLVSNIDSSLYLQHKLNYQTTLLQLQSDNRVDENSEVIIDECSILRHRIIQRSFLPGRRQNEIKPTHLPPRPESTMTRVKPRSRGTGELSRWLSETRLGLHDHNWLKHARKLYRNSCLDDIKGSTILDLLEQVVKIQPDSRRIIKWQNIENKDITLEPEEQLGIQLVMRYGTYHRLIQSTQLNMDNLTYLIRLVKASLSQKSIPFEGFDWFVASVYLLCSGNIERSQNFLSLILMLPTAPILWLRFGEISVLAQVGNVLETIISDEMPSLYQVLQSKGLSWWQLCQTWITQCWWNILDWQQICHWFALSILYQLDYSLYFCVAILQVNQDHILKMAKQGTVYEIVINPIEMFHLSEVRILIEKLNKKYHNSLHSHLTSI